MIKDNNIKFFNISAGSKDEFYEVALKNSKFANTNLIIDKFQERENLGSIQIFEDTLMPHAQVDTMPFNEIHVYTLDKAIRTWNSYNDIKYIVLIIMGGLSSSQDKQEVVNFIKALGVCDSFEEFLDRNRRG